MPLTVKVVTPPASEPVTLAEAKSQVRQPADFVDDDALLSSLVVAARRYCEAVMKGAFVDTEFELADDAFPFSGGYPDRQTRAFYGQFSGLGGRGFPVALGSVPGVITLPRAPVRSVTSVTYLDATGNTVTLDPSRYAVTTGAPGRVAPAFGTVWPATLPQIGAVRVRFVAGYGPDASAVPDNVKAAIRLMVGHWYENRESVVVGPGITCNELPQAVDHLLGVEQWGGYA